MTTRATFVIAAVLWFLLPARAQAQDSPPDEFDLGDHWVDDEVEGGWFAPWAPELSGAGRAFQLDLSAGMGSTSVLDGRAGEDTEGRTSRTRDYYALATLQIPLDDLFSSARRPPAPVESDEMRLARNEEPKGEEEAVPSASSTESTSAGVGSERDGPSGAESPEGAHGPRSTPESTKPSGTHPSVILAVAREIADRVGSPLLGAQQRLKSLVRRSRWSGLSPELRLRGVLGFDRTTSTEESVGIYPGDTTVRGARDSLAEVRLTFRLDRLVLGDGEDSLERQRIDLEEDKRKLMGEALELFSVWRLAEAKSRDLSLPPDEILEALVDAESAMLKLHLMTGGWFSGRESIEDVARSLPDAGRGEP